MPDASPILTWDIAPADGGARRPSLADVGNATIEDEDPAPDKASMPYANQLNEWARQIAAQGKVCPCAIISVDYASTAPFIVSATGPGTNITATAFTIVELADVGDVQISWASGTLPASSGIQPTATVNVVTTAQFIGAKRTGDSVEVRTFDSDTGFARIPFTICIY